MDWEINGPLVINYGKYAAPYDMGNKRPGNTRHIIGNRRPPGYKQQKVREIHGPLGNKWREINDGKFLGQHQKS